MEPIEFVKAVREHVVESDFLMYKTTFDSAPGANDPVWKAVLPVYSSLTPEQKNAFLNFIRLVQVNAVSHLFGILDGSSFLTESREDLILSTESDKEVINGDLTDIFLEMEEEGI